MKTFTINNNTKGKIGSLNIQKSGTEKSQVPAPDNKNTLDVPVILQQQNYTPPDQKIDNNTTLKTVNMSIKDAFETLSKGNVVIIPSNAKNSSQPPSENSKGGKPGPNKSQIGNIGNVNTLGSKKEKVIDGVSQQASPGALSNQINLYDQEFTVSEKLTGLSQERPEVILLTHFLPLFEKIVGSAGFKTSDTSTAQGMGYESSLDYGLTSAGEYFDTTYKSRLLKIFNSKIAANLLSQNDASKCKDGVESALDEAYAILHNMFDITQSGNYLKSVMEIRNIECNANTMVKRILEGDLRSSTGADDEGLDQFDQMTNFASFAPSVVNGKFTIAQVLNSFGFKLNALNSLFSSSKLWMQLLYELNVMLKHHSDFLIDAQTNTQQLDVDPITINKHSPSLKRLGSRFILTPPYGTRATLPSLLDINTLNGFKTDVDINSFVEMIVDARDQLFAGVNFANDETRIAVLTNFISQEYRYSRALKLPTFKQLLLDSYGYTTVDADDAGNNNVGFLDAVVGTIPDKIVDVVKGNSARSLMSVSQTVLVQHLPNEKDTAGQTKGVLPFETRYVEIDVSTVTPGGVFYVDNVYDTDGQNFNTTNLKTYFNTVSEAIKHFIPVSLATNMYMFDPGPDGKVGQLKVFGENSFNIAALSDARGLFNLLLNNMTVTEHYVGDNTPIDGFGNAATKYSPQNPNGALWGIFAYGAKNPRVMALLYVLVMTHMQIFYGTSLPQPADRKLIMQKVLDTIIEDFANSPQSGKIEFSGIDQEFSGIIDNFTHENGVCDFIAKCILQFNYQFTKLANKNNRTQYSGVPISLFSMTLFEIVCIMANSYGNSHLRALTKTSTNYTAHFDVTNDQYDTSINNIIIKLNAERVRMQGTLVCMNSILATLGAAVKSHLALFEPVEILQSGLNQTLGGKKTVPNSHAVLVNTNVKMLRDISTLLDDPMYVNLLLNEQQLMTAFNAVQDAKFPISQINEIDEVFTIIDDAIDRPNKTTMLDAMYSLFSGAEFQRLAGYNKRIITVGLPSGFSNKFKQRRTNVVEEANKQTSLLKKANDIIRVNVRKIDVRYSELVFKPQTFIFDLSRYPARTPFLILDSDTKNITLDNLASYVATRDFGAISGVSHRGMFVEYYAADSAQETYPFLSTSQRSELFKNHALSYMLEVYVRIMTGMNICENAFVYRSDLAQIITQETASKIVAAGLANITSNLKNSGSKKLSVFSKTQKNASQSKNKTTQSVQGAMSSLPSTMSADTAQIEFAKQCEALNRMLSTLSNPVHVKQKFLYPKQFDRIFNVIVDPDDFELDTQMSSVTLAGRNAIDSLVQQGELLLVEDQADSKNTKNVRYISRQKTANDTSFEKYIVNVESLDDDGV